MKPWLAFVESNTSGTGRLFARAAAQHGFRPIVLTADPSRYKYMEEEGIDVLQVDTQNVQALLDCCQRLAVDSKLSAVTTSSEYFVVTAATLARRLGLPGPRPDAVRVCRDKGTQRLRLEAAGIGVPQFRLARSVKAAVAAAGDIGFPVIVKPVKGTGSLGVKLCEHVKDVAAHAGALLRERRNERGLPIPHRILVEELAVGPEYSVETFGREVVGITEKHLGTLPYFVEVGHDYPAILSVEVKETIHRAVLRTVEALSLGWGPAHIELRLTEGVPKIIEVNPRLAGGYIPELVRLSNDIDLISETVRLALGQEPLLEKKADRHTSIRFLLPPLDGTLLRVEGLEVARRVPAVTEVQLYARLGDCVRLRGDFRDRIGHVIAVGDTPATAQAAAEQAHGIIQLIVEPDSIKASERV